MVTAELVVDQKGNLKAASSRVEGKGMIHEFSFPHFNEDPSGTAWRKGNAYMLAFLVGPGPEFKGITQDVWMSPEVLVRVGGPSEDSIYRPAEVTRHPAEGGRP